MSKKSALKKRMLGKQIKRAGRMPLLAVVRTHRKLQSNRFARNWRRTKLRLKVK